MSPDPTTLPGWRWLPGMQLRTPDGRLWRVYDRAGCGLAAVAESTSLPVWERLEDLSGAAPVAADPATGGILTHLLGAEAWRVRYSPSMHKRAAGTPWVADLVGTVTLHPSQGEAAAAVAGALGRWA